MAKISGIYTAIITPFDKQGQVDEIGLRHNIRFQLEGGVNGITSLGTTGEAPTLSSAEKEKVILISKEETKERVPLMVGTGSYSTAQTIESTSQAKNLGADSVLIVTPYYNKPTQEGLYQHFKAIAKAVDIPIMIYNIQSRTGQNLQTETLKKLADIPTIIGVKEGSGSLVQMGEVIEYIGKQRPDFSVMSADDALTLPLMAIGGNGIISVVSNLIPKEITSLVKAAQEGNYKLAKEIHYQLMPLIRIAFIETNPIPIKAAMNLWGMPAGPCRLPLCELSENNEIKLKQTVEKHSLSLKDFQQIHSINITW